MTMTEGSSDGGDGEREDVEPSPSPTLITPSLLSSPPLVFTPSSSSPAIEEELLGFGGEGDSSISKGGGVDGGDIEAAAATAASELIVAFPALDGCADLSSFDDSTMSSLGRARIFLCCFFNLFSCLSSQIYVWTSNDRCSFFFQFPKSVFLVLHARSTFKKKHKQIIRCDLSAFSVPFSVYIGGGVVEGKGDEFATRISF